MERIEVTPAEYDQLTEALKEPPKVLPRLALLLSECDHDCGNCPLRGKDNDDA